MKKEYTFTLKYKLPSNITDIDALVDELYQAGCDDALIGIGMPGYIAFDFIREANNAKEAIQSAQAEILACIPKAELVEISPDYVGLTDIAELVGVTRQQMRKIYETANSFPAPVHSGKAAVWRLAEVLEWVEKNKNYTFSQQAYEVARAALDLNNARLGSHKPSFSSFSKEMKIIFNSTFADITTFTEQSHVQSSARIA